MAEKKFWECQHDNCIMIATHGKIKNTHCDEHKEYDMIFNSSS